jgi:hypothetical protein
MQDFSGGVNLQAAPYMIQGNQAREALNVCTSGTGDIEKRNGFVTLSGTSLTGSPVEATGVHSLFPANTATKSLLGVATTSTTDTIFKLTTAGVASVLETEMTAGKRWYWAQAEVNGKAGPIFGLNGTDVPQRWDGAAAATSEWKATTGTVPKAAKFLTYFSERLWCAAGTRLYFSGITGSTPDPLNWASEDYVDLEPNDGQSITGIGIVGNLLVVFKSRKTYAVYDPVTAANRPLSNALGCVSHRSIVQTPAGLFFLSEDQGVCKTDGKAVAPFSDGLKPLLDEVAAAPSTQANAAGTALGRRYYLSISKGGTRNDHTIEYDLITGSWWIHDCAVNQFALLDPGGTPVLHSADSLASARVSNAFVPEVFTDNGANYAGKAFYVTPHHAWGFSGSIRYLRYVDPHKIKRIREVRVDGVGNWEAYVAVDFTDNWQLMDGEVWDQSGELESGNFEGVGGAFEGEGFGTFEENPLFTVDRHYHTPALGRAISFKYVNDSANNFRIYSETVNIQLRED